jgi:hypothetical protein
VFDSADDKIAFFWIIAAIIVTVLFFRPDGCRSTLASGHRFRSEVNIVEQYRGHATACEKIAASAISGEHRQHILEMAQAWRDLADQRERMLKEAPRRPFT